MSGGESEKRGVLGRILAEKPKPSSPWMRVFAIVCTAIGVGGIAWILDDVGLDALWEALSGLSWGRFLAVLAWYYLVYAFDAQSWRILIPEHVRPSLWAATKACLAGSAINMFTPTGNLGEPVKIALLSRRTDPSLATAALVTWNFLHSLGTVVWVLLSAVPIFLYLEVEPELMLAYVGGAILMLLPAMALFLAVRGKFVSRLVGLASRVGIAARRLEGWTAQARKVEEAVLEHARRRPMDLVWSMVYLLVSRAISITTSFGIMWALGLDVPVLTMLFIQMLNMAVGMLFAFVPGRVGVAEGYNTAIFLALHYTPQEGLAVSVVGRGIQLLTAAMAVLVLGQASVGSEKRVTNARASR